MRKYQDLYKDYQASEEVKARIESELRTLDNELNYYRHSYGDKEATDKAALADQRALNADLKM